MELYDSKDLNLPEDLIKVRADNGYGKMVTRRRDNHTVRVSSMPDPTDQGAHGIRKKSEYQKLNHMLKGPLIISHGR